MAGTGGKGKVMSESELRIKALDFVERKEVKTPEEIVKEAKIFYEFITGTKK
jgi:hypothetical protein